MDISVYEFVGYLV